ncbi:predicted protein [Uncinocarpus reesii 1704]|uniref:Uncharacterized protein n=1 Tax=Uncinocarpus reesii (strain UAMH 1704) TaxID=336963 RepID=C4JT97_UNCRE|nr:uncharacterized protein UREG_05686 [Uncinocarpus reesii 1704]EEP80844.1 predicted protein [Uncinocarpus reesii 1704]
MENGYPKKSSLRRTSSSIQKRGFVIRNNNYKLSLEATSASVAKLQTEKLSLMRENSSMKLEMSQLRSQQASQQAAITEKLKSEIDRRTLAENEVNELKSKLKVANQKTRTIPHDSTFERQEDVADVRVLKGGEDIPNLTHFRHKMTIATPGAANLPQKRKKASALLGDISSFSVTPFLNRANTDEAPDISSEEPEDSPVFETRALAPRSIKLSNAESHSPTNLRPPGNEAIPPSTKTLTGKLTQNKHDSYRVLNKRKTQPRKTSASQVVDEPSQSTLTEQQRGALKKRRVLGSKREGNVFDSGDDLGNYRNFQGIESRDGHKQGMQTLQFSPLKRQTRPV